MMSRLEVQGIAHLCCHEDLDAFTGVLITRDKHQYGLKGIGHHCEEHGQHHGEQDDHTCCYDDTAQSMDLIISKLGDKSTGDITEDIMIPHVVKSGGDNCSLSSPYVDFLTNDLLVGEKADKFIAKYLSPELHGKNCFVCIGEMTIRFPNISD